MAPLLPLIGAGLGAVMAPTVATAIGITSTAGIGALTAGMAMAGQSLFGAVTGKKPGLDTLLTGVTAGIGGGAVAGMGKGAASAGLTAGKELAAPAMQELAPVSGELAQTLAAGGKASDLLASSLGSSASTTGTFSPISSGFTQSMTALPQIGGATKQDLLYDAMIQSLKPESTKDVFKKSLITSGLGTGLQSASAYLLRPDQPQTPTYQGGSAPNKQYIDAVQGPLDERIRAARQRTIRRRQLLSGGK